MKLHQLSIFLENKPGQLNKVCQALAKAEINILTLSLADTQQFGILRLIVRDWSRAQTILQAEGFTTKVTEVLAVEVQDQPGGLAKILAAVDAAKLNVEYMYAFASRPQGKAVLIFRFTDPDQALAGLQRQKVSLVASVELFNAQGR